MPNAPTATVRTPGAGSLSLDGVSPAGRALLTELRDYLRAWPLEERSPYSMAILASVRTWVAGLHALDHGMFTMDEPTQLMRATLAAVQFEESGGG